MVESFSFQVNLFDTGFGSIPLCEFENHPTLVGNLSLEINRYNIQLMIYTPGLSAYHFLFYGISFDLTQKMFFYHNRKKIKKSVILTLSGLGLTVGI